MAQVCHNVLVKFRKGFRVFIDGVGLVQFQPVLEKVLQLSAGARIAHHAFGLRTNVIGRFQIARLDGHLE